MSLTEKSIFGADDLWYLALPVVGPGLFVASQLADAGTVINESGQVEDMNAINAYMMHTQAVTPRGKELQNQWIGFWSQLSWYDLHASTASLDEARNRKNAFVIANQPTEADKQAMRDQIATGVTAEEMRGEPKRTDESGFYEAPATDEDKPWLPPWTLPAVGITILAAVGVGLASAVSKLFR